MASLLPPYSGLLPYWILVVAIASIGNSIQTYTTLSYTRRLYAGPPPSSSSSSTKETKTTITVFETTAPPAAARPRVQSSATAESHTSPVTPLSARTFGTWTFLTSIVRLYVAYHINDPMWYQLGIWTFLIAFGHFMSEAFIFHAAQPRGPWLAPTSVATGSLIWMLAQWNFYVN